MASTPNPQTSGRTGRHTNPPIHFLPRRLIVNADDFGRSSATNQAVVCAHREGILTTASLMVNEPAWEEAVMLARQNPRLGVGSAPHLAVRPFRIAVHPPFPAW